VGGVERFMDDYLCGRDGSNQTGMENNRRIVVIEGRPSIMGRAPMSSQHSTFSFRE
jgi:hypothetical protein